MTGGNMEETIFDMTKFWNVRNDIETPFFEYNYTTTAPLETFEDELEDVKAEVYAVTGDENIQINTNIDDTILAEFRGSVNNKLLCQIKKLDDTSVVLNYTYNMIPELARSLTEYLSNEYEIPEESAADFKLVMVCLIANLIYQNSALQDLEGKDLEVSARFSADLSTFMQRALFCCELDSEFLDTSTKLIATILLEKSGDLAYKVQAKAIEHDANLFINRGFDTIGVVYEKFKEIYKEACTKAENTQTQNFTDSLKTMYNRYEIMPEVVYDALTTNYDELAYCFSDDIVKEVREHIISDIVMKNTTEEDEEEDIEND